jgi:hypothetical protein
MNFRLRNTEQYDLIIKEFLRKEFDIIKISNFNHKELRIEFLYEYINENKLREQYEKIVLISNIEDAVFIWYRMYNFLIDDFIFLSKLYKVLLNIITFRKNKSEALNLLIKIPRSDIFVFNQILIGETYIIYNLEEFIMHYSNQEQEDIQKWINDNYYDKRDINISENERNLYNNFIETYKTVEEFIQFINSLHFSEGGVVSSRFNKLLEYWYKEKPNIFNELSINKISEIIYSNVIDVIKQFMLENELIRLDIDNIDESTDIEDLKRYMDFFLRKKEILEYKKLLEIFKKETKENIKWFVDNSFINIFFQIQEDISTYNLYKSYILELLDLIIKYRFTTSIYLTFILEKLSQSIIHTELVKNKIKEILYIPSNEENIEEIEIDSEDNLKKIFSFLGYTLEDIFIIPQEN